MGSVGRGNVQLFVRPARLKKGVRRPVSDRAQLALGWQGSRSSAGMQRANATARHERQLESRGAIGFAVRDAAGRGHAFQVDFEACQPLVFGSASPIPVVGPNVLPAHFVVLPHDGVLLAASANAEQPAMLNGVALPTSWTLLQVPSRIRIGSAAVDFFHADDSGTVLVDLDIETTVTVTETPRDVTPTPAPTSLSGTRRRKGPLPRPSPPPRRLESGPRLIESRPPPPPSPLVPPGPRPMSTMQVQVPTPIVEPPTPTPTMSRLERVRQTWANAPMSTRVRLGVVALLLIFLLLR